MAKPAAAAAKKEEWTCPADGMVHPWPYKGKTYLRNSDNEIWARGADGGCGDWMGIYLPAEDRIDDSVPEPEFEDDEDDFDEEDDRRLGAREDRELHGPAQARDRRPVGAEWRVRPGCRS